MKHDNFDEVHRQATERDGAQTLQRTLKPQHLMVLGAGAMIGAGIFVATGHVAATLTGPAIVLSFVIAALGVLCAALCYAELSAMMPVAGSSFSYVYATFGRGIGWMIAWCLILEYLMAGATIAVGWSGYLVGLLSSFGVTIAPALTSPPFTVSPGGGFVSTGALLNLPAVLLLSVLTALSLGGLRLSIGLNSLLVGIKLAAIALFIVCGSLFVDPANWKPFLPENTGVFGEFGWSGVIRGAGVIFFAYLGFDAISTAGRETVNPNRSMPLGILGSLAMCTIVYIAFSLVLTGLAPYPMLGAANPVSVALEHAGPQLFFVKVAVEIGAVVGLTSVVMVMLYGQSRIVFALAQNNLVPAVFGRIGVRTKAPYASIIGCGLISGTAGALLPVDVLSQLISIGTLCAFVFVCAAVLVLRVRHPELERPFRMPFAPVICVAGILICAYLMASLPLATWLQFLVWVAIGVAIYFAYGRRHKE